MMVQEGVRQQEKKYEGGHEEARSQDSMVVSFLCEEEVTRREIHEEWTTRRRYDFGSIEESDDKDANMAMHVPLEENYEQELVEAWDDIDGPELEPEMVRKARALDMERCRKMNVYKKRPI